MRAPSSHASGKIILRPLTLGLIGLLCLLTVIRSYLLLIHNSLHVAPSPIFSIYSSDFLCFYTAAQVGIKSLVGVYDPTTLFAAQSAVTSVAGAVNPNYLYVYPPFIAVLFRPLASLSFINAYFAWLLISYAAVALVTHVLLPRDWSAPQRWAMSLFAPAVFPFFSFHALMSGQTTALGIIILGVTITIKRHNPLLAGVVFALGLYKPPLFAVFALLALLRREWRFLGGACIGALSILGASLATFGVEPLMAFANSALRYVYGGTLIDGTALPPGKGMGLASALLCLTPSPRIGWSLFGLAALAMIVVHLKLMKRSSGDDALQALFDTCSAITLTYFLSIQSINYDAGLLLIPATLLFVALKDSQRDAPIMMLSLAFMMAAGTMSTENGSSVCAGFLAVAAFWMAVTFLWWRHASAKAHA